ncbi:hypothetical protein BH23ACT10_BH23ACT10_16920 [soil metagenome]
MAEQHAFVLIHSPLAGAGTWQPVADILADRGLVTTVPELTDDGAPPFWRQHTRCVVRGIAEHIEPGIPLVLVAHSAAGQLLGVLGPVLRDAGYHVAAEILADAGLPPEGRSRLDQLDDDAPERAEQVRSLLDEGVGFPSWTDDEIAPLVPDDDRRAQLLEQLRPPPAAYWVEQIPTAVDWPDAPVGALIFSSSYAPTLQAATDNGWLVNTLDTDNHLLMLVNEQQVADELLALTDRLVDDDGRRDMSRAG